LGSNDHRGCGVYLIALVADAWSHSSVSFFISTVGDTSPATVSYKKNFTNDFAFPTSLLVLPNMMDISHVWMSIRTVKINISDAVDIRNGTFPSS
jgi:hypothetical protein